MAYLYGMPFMAAQFMLLSIWTESLSSWTKKWLNEVVDKAEAIERLLTGTLKNALTALPPPRDPSALLPVVAYLRYSTKNQKPQSLKRQLFLIERDAARLGLRVVAVFVDEGVSGRLLHRKGLDDAIRFCKNGGANGILVEDCDRLARQCSIIPVLWDDLNAHGCTLWDRRQGAIDTPLKANIFSGMAAEEHRKLRERTMVARRQRVEDIGPWRVPYGYMINPYTGEILLHPVHSKIVQEDIFAELAAGRTDGDVARTLNQKKIPPPSAGTKQAGKKWRAPAVARVRLNGTYKGLFLWGKDQAKSGLPVVKFLLKDELILVDEITWERINIAASARCTHRNSNSHKSAPRKVDRVSPDYLKKKVFCSCKEQMSSSSDPTRPGMRQFYCEGGDNLHDGFRRVHGWLVRLCVSRALKQELSPHMFQERFEEFTKIAKQKFCESEENNLNEMLHERDEHNKEMQDSFTSRWGNGFTEAEKANRRRYLEKRRNELNKLIAVAELNLRGDEENSQKLSKMSDDLATVIEDLAIVPPGQLSATTVATLRAVIHKVVVHAHDNGRRDITVHLSPAADGESDKPKTLPVSFTYFSTYQIQDGDHEFINLLRDRIEAGQWLITESQMRGMLTQIPALKQIRPNWTLANYISFLRLVTISSQMSVRITKIRWLYNDERSRGIIHYAAEDFRNAGGMAQLRQCLESGACPTLGVTVGELPLGRSSPVPIEWSV